MTTFRLKALLIASLTVLLFAPCGDDNPVNDQENELGPLLGITSTPDTLVEAQQMGATINLSLDAEPPADGVLVPIAVNASDGSEKPLARFKLETFNPQEAIQGAILVEQPNLSELNRLVLSMVEREASINLTVSDDEFDDGPLQVSFSLLESADQAFTVDENNSTTSFTIIEGVTAGITSTPDTLIENNRTVAEININLNQDPGSEGLLIPLDVRASDGSAKPLARFDIAAFDAKTDLEGATLAEEPDLSTLNELKLILTEQQATLTLTVADDEFDSGPLNVSFSLQESDNGEYVIEEEAGSTSFTIVEN